MKIIMLKLSTSILFLALLPFLTAQDYLINFEASGVSTKIDTVKVWNQSQNKYLTLIGNSSLHLRNTITDIKPIYLAQSRELSIYPNPMNEYSLIEFDLLNSGLTIIEIYDVSGRLQIQTQNTLPSGRNSFQVSGLRNGIYIIRVSLLGYIYFGKIVSVNCEGENAQITYLNTSNINRVSGSLKNTTSDTQMQYNLGDTLLLTFISDNYSTTQSDVPSGSKTISSYFYLCKDFEDNNYPVVQIGEQVWMAKNLMSTKLNDGIEIPYQSAEIEEGDITTPEYCWYNNDSVSYSHNYGALYNWYAINTNKLCPTGWHVPNKYEWEILFSELGGGAIAGGNMKEIGTEHWKYPNFGATNISGFSALPAGFTISTYFSYMNEQAYFATSSVNQGNEVIFRLDYNEPNIVTTEIMKQAELSVRCILDTSATIVHTTPVIFTADINEILSTTAVSGGIIKLEGNSSVSQRGVCWSTETYPDTLDNKTIDDNGIGNYISTITGLTENTIYFVRAYAVNSSGISYGNVKSFKTKHIGGGFVTDFDGNEYDTIVIGNQTWMTEDLKTSHYRNGDTIITTFPSTKIISDENAPKYQWAYDGYEANVATWGRLYTAFTVTDSRNLCPTNWHVPSITEWSTLIGYLNDTLGAADKMMEAGTAHWIAPNENATNESGFTALPGGFRNDYYGSFYHRSIESFWWTSTDYGNVNGSEENGYVNIYPNVNNEIRTNEITLGATNSRNGYYVRCMKD